MATLLDRILVTLSIMNNGNEYVNTPGWVSHGLLRVRIWYASQKALSGNGRCCVTPRPAYALSWSPMAAWYLFGHIGLLRGIIRWLNKTMVFVTAVDVSHRQWFKNTSR